MPGGVLGGVVGGLLEGIGPEARVIYQPCPEYPILAQQAGIQGEAIISAVIDSQGNVVNMKVVSGPPLLYLAIKALANWKFEPTYLDGEPVAIKWDVSVKLSIAKLHKNW